MTFARIKLVNALSYRAGNRPIVRIDEMDSFHKNRFFFILIHVQHKTLKTCLSTGLNRIFP